MKKIYANNGSITKIGIWGRKNGSEGTFMPRQADKSNETFDILIDNEKVTVFCNTSKSHAPYYYLKIGGLWHWTRDNNIRTYARYRLSSPTFFVE